LYEGSYVNDTFVYDDTNSNQRFVISNPTVDISSVIVTVLENSGADVLSYSRALSLFDVSSTSKVFFVQPAENSQYEILFGDGVFGRKPVNGSVVAVEYRTCSGELPNGASTFVNDGPIDGHSGVVVSTVSSAINGSVSESIESVRFNAPRAVATQERAVTANDYKVLLQMQYPEIQSINVYGGEDTDPPQYGKVFITVDIQNADGVPAKNKQLYYDYIRTKSPLTITPEFIDPEFTYIDVNTIVKYNVNVSQKQPEEIKTVVQSAINDFSNTYLDDFESTLRYSQLVAAIDNSDVSIVGNETIVRAIKLLAAPTLQFNQSKNYTVKFDIPLSREYYVTSTTFDTQALHTITSSTFIYAGKTCLIKDNAGQLNIVSERGNTTFVVKTIGTVDYDTGTLVLSGFNPSDAFGGVIKFYAYPVSRDIFSRKNIILRVLEQDIDITVERVHE